MKIVFFHHAGSDQYSFASYLDLCQELEWEPVFYELPGHGDRYSEPLLNDISSVMADVWEKLGDQLSSPYSIFGNSMGSLIGFQFMREAESNSRPLPKHFFGVSRMCPASYSQRQSTLVMSSEEFWEMIKAYGDTSGILENPEMKAFYEPVLRADFNILQSYTHRQNAPLNIPATIIYGSEDRYSDEEMLSWQQHFRTTAIMKLSGGHFIAMERPSELIRIIQDQLRSNSG